MKYPENMLNKDEIKEVDEIVVRFSGDSGDGMQLTGTIFSNLSAIFGNQIATFPDFPSEIRAPIGTLSGVSGFQVKLGDNVHSAGNRADVLVAMNPAALKVCAKKVKKDSVIIVDSDSFSKRDLEKAEFKTEEPFAELNLLTQHILSIPISSLTKESLAEEDVDMKTKLRCKNMFALGVVCWLFNQKLDVANHILESRFAKKPLLADINIKVLADGYNFGHNQHLSVPTYRVKTVDVEKGHYIDINGNAASAYGLVAVAEKSGKELFLGSYPITPATDILKELSGLKHLGVKAVQAEDEIAAIAMSIGASFAGKLAATSTSGPGLALKSEAIGLAVMAELPLVIIDVQRGGPSTGLPTKSEQTDLRQALYGRNGEAPLVVLAPSSPINCFDMSYWAAKLTMEHMTPVIVLSDGYIANGTSSWKIPDLDSYPPIVPHDTKLCKKEDWTPALRNSETLARYWAEPGTEGFAYRAGGLETHYDTRAISTEASNHEKMIKTRKEKVERISEVIPELKVEGVADADILIVGWGGTHGHLLDAIERIRKNGKKLALAHFTFISPLPKNTKEVLSRYKKIIVAEQNNGQFAGYLQENIDGLNIIKFNRIEGQPFSISELVEAFTQELEKQQ